LVLIGKVLQNLACGLEFPPTQGYMMSMNPFINSNIPILNDFFYNLVNVNEGNAQLVKVDVSKQAAVNSANGIKQTLTQHRSTLEVELTSINENDSKKLLDRLNTVLEDIGPPEPKRPTNASKRPKP